VSGPNVEAIPVLEEAAPAPPAVPVLELAEDDRSARHRISAIVSEAVRHPLRTTGAAIRMLFGLASLILLLAVIAAIPIVNFLALGYLLEAEGRVARSGKLSDAFPLLSVAPRLGSIVLGFWLWLLPLRLMADFAADAQVIGPGGAAARGWNTALTLASIFITIHLCLALAHGNSLASFFRPIRNARWLWSRWRAGTYWQEAGDASRSFIAGLQLKHHFWLGLRGFFGVLAWLIVPTLLYASLQDTSQPVQVLLTLLGGTCLVIVLGWLPFLQARFAAENRWRAMFELGAVRELYRRSPLLWSVALVLLYALSLPLYLFKIVLPPQDAMWGVTLVFILTIYPARIAIGWAYHRATRREKRTWFLWRLLTRAAVLPLLGIYVFLLFFTPAIGEHGRRVLFEHHALLLQLRL